MGYGRADSFQCTPVGVQVRRACVAHRLAKPAPPPGCIEKNLRDHSPQHQTTPPDLICEPALGQKCKTRDSVLRVCTVGERTCSRVPGGSLRYRWRALSSQTPLGETAMDGPPVSFAKPVAARWRPLVQENCNKPQSAGTRSPQVLGSSLRYRWRALSSQIPLG